MINEKCEKKQATHEKMSFVYANCMKAHQNRSYIHTKILDFYYSFVTHYNVIIVNVCSGSTLNVQQSRSHGNSTATCYRGLESLLGFRTCLIVFYDRYFEHV